MGQDTHIETRDGWVEITIHRPEKMNAIREQTAAEVLEALDRVKENEAIVERAMNEGSSEAVLDTSQLDPSSEEWEGSLDWNVEDYSKTVAEEIGKVDLASLADWDE